MSKDFRVRSLRLLGLAKEESLRDGKEEARMVERLIEQMTRLKALSAQEAHGNRTYFCLALRNKLPRVKRGSTVCFAEGRP